MTGQKPAQRVAPQVSEAEDIYSLMGAIKKLDKDVVNRIAAGEVIQRPSSALKELMENSIDAGSTSIVVTAKEGGLKSLSIQDNGKGIAKDDMEIVCERFTTSKLVKYDDLKAISTFGFRGEALASISHVARLTITTQTAAEQVSYKASYSDGRPVGGAPPKMIAGVKGTTILVEDMFFNVPTRRKAIKSPSEEHRRIVEVVSRYAIAYAGIAFTVKKAGVAGNDVHTQVGWDTRACIRAIHGSDVVKELLDFTVALDPVSGVEAEGCVSNANASYKRTVFILFINGRLVDCAPIKKALESAYSAYLPRGTHPWIFLKLKLPPANVDVNIHPTKSEVRFMHEDRVVEVLQGAVQEQLAGANSSRTFLSQSTLVAPAPSDNGAGTVLPSATAVSSQRSSGRQRPDRMVRQDGSTQRGQMDKYVMPSSQAPPSSIPGPIGDLDHNPGAGIGSVISRSKVSARYDADDVDDDDDDDMVLVAPKNMTSRPTPATTTTTATTAAAPPPSSSSDSRAPLPQHAQKPMQQPPPPPPQQQQNQQREQPSSITAPAAAASSPPPPRASRAPIPAAAVGMLPPPMAVPEPLPDLMDPTSIAAPGSSSPASLSQGSGSLSRKRPSAHQEGDASDAPVMGGMAPPSKKARSSSTPAKAVSVAAQQLTSVQTLLGEVTAHSHEGLVDLLRNSSFVGVVDNTWSLLQSGTRLYLADMTVLSRELVYQLIFRRFGAFARIRFKTPLSVSKLFALGRSDIDNHQEDVVRSSQQPRMSEDEFCQLMLSRAPMLDDYFGMTVQASDDDVVLESLPQILDGYAPSLAALPEFFFRLSVDVNWNEEMPCFRSMAHALADFYAIQPSLFVEATTSPEASQDSQGLGSSSPTGPKLAVNEEARLSILQHIVLPLCKTHLSPPQGWAAAAGLPNKSARSSGVSSMSSPLDKLRSPLIEVARLENLYKVFERC